MTGPAGGAVAEPQGRGPAGEADDLAVSARAITVDGPWGHSFGPVDLDIAAGGVTVISAPVSRARNALMLTLCARMRPRKGSISILGHANRPRAAFKETALSLMDEVDEIEQSVRVRDLITEKRRWNAPWYKFIRQADQAQLEKLCGFTFGEVALPPLREFFDRLPELQQVLLRIALGNTPRKPLLTVGSLDGLTSDAARAFVYGRLAELGREQTVIVADENERTPIPGCREIIELPHLTGIDRPWKPGQEGR